MNPADPHPQVIGELLDERRSEDAPLLGGQQPLALGEVEIEALQHLVERPVGRSVGDPDHEHAVVRLGVDAEVGLGELLPEIHDRPRHALGQLARRRADPRDLVGQRARDLERARQRPLRCLGGVVGRGCAERRGDEPAAGQPAHRPERGLACGTRRVARRLGVARVVRGVARGVVEARERGDAFAVRATQVGERRRHLLVAQAQRRSLLAERGLAGGVLGTQAGRLLLGGERLTLADTGPRDERRLSLALAGEDFTGAREGLELTGHTGHAPASSEHASRRASSASSSSSRREPMRDRVLALLGLRGDQHAGVSRRRGFRVLVLGHGAPLDGDGHAKAAQRRFEGRGSGERREVGVERRRALGQPPARRLDLGLPGDEGVECGADLGQPAGATGRASGGPEVLGLLLGGTAVQGAEDERPVGADRRLCTCAECGRPIGHGREDPVDWGRVERGGRICR